MCGLFAIEKFRTCVDSSDSESTQLLKICAEAGLTCDGFLANQVMNFVSTLSDSSPARRTVAGG